MSNLPAPDPAAAGEAALPAPPMGMLCIRLWGIAFCGVESGVVCMGEPPANGDAPELAAVSRLNGEVSPVAVVGFGAEANRLAALKLDSGDEDCALAGAGEAGAAGSA